MLKKVLILTPSPGFGGLIRQLLEDTGGFAPLLVADPRQAMQLAQKEALALTILDADLDIADFPKYISELRTHAPQSRLIVVPGDKNPTNPQLNQLDANAVLSTPFYLPDLVTAIEQLFGPLVPEPAANRKMYGRSTGPISLPELEIEPEPKQPAPEWLRNVSQAARYLTRLSLESSSQAALITRGEQVWAYAGELPKEAADELADFVAEHVSTRPQTDLARFVRLKTTNAGYMVYATSLGSDFRLALVFDTETPFSKMRSHVSDMAKALAAPEQAATVGVSEIAPPEKQADVNTPSNQPVKDLGKKQIQQERSTKKQVATLSETERETSVPENAIALKGDQKSIFSTAFIPRLPKHRLEGDIASRIGIWLPELCIAYACRLEAQTIKPDHLQFSFSLLTEATPESVVRSIMTQLSVRIFDEFPRLTEENPSGEFWAPGYLMVNGNLGSSQILEFITQTRIRQGAI
jgi:REP element-mobilizing transposase RayT/DNA-binding NarL/FixJ family response regulator